MRQSQPRRHAHRAFVAFHERLLVRTGLLRQRSKLLDLPFEILHLVCDELPLADRFTLSRLSKFLRHVLQARLLPDLRKASVNERLACLKRLALLYSTEYNICFPCQSLHRKSTTCIFAVRRSPIWSSDADIPFVAKASTQGYFAMSVEHRHVTNAMQYAKLPFEETPYISRILPSIPRFQWYDCGMRLGIRMESRIIQGRFILRTEREFSSIDGQELSLETLQVAKTCICPHLTINQTAICQRDALTVCIMTLFSKRKSCASGSCFSCPTDFSITFCRNRRGMFITTYQNLGSGKPSVDAYWRSLVEGPHNNSDLYRVLDYKHGSVRRRWDYSNRRSEG